MFLSTCCVFRKAASPRSGRSSAAVAAATIVRTMSICCAACATCLYGEGYTIRGVQRILREEGLSFVQGVWRTGAEPPAAVELEDEDEAESAGELAGEAEAEDEAESEAEGEVTHKPPARAVVLCRAFHNCHANGRTPRARIWCRRPPRRCGSRPTTKAGESYRPHSMSWSLAAALSKRS